MVNKWKASEISVSVGGVEVVDFLGFEADDGKEITHIEAVDRIAGYNIKLQKPTWSLKCRVTSEALNKIEEMYTNEELISVTVKTPNLTINCYDAIIKSIKPSEINDEAPEVTIEGLCMKIERKWE
ncbi:hypothetical protein DRP05_10560 [Archaeoglobales archaeon]|nr:MAG: hypothetical protein DRP05_10560 [Archaeoglobales archaeon]